MYNLTRQDASILLNMSTRNLDRYIKSGKIRIQKKWKVIYLNSDDVDKIQNKWKNNQEVIISKKSSFVSLEKESQAIEVKNESTNFIYTDLKKLLIEKDKKIEDLTYALWKIEENLKNSITMIEFKKSQFLLEQSRESLEKDLEIEKNKSKDLEEKLLKENKINLVLISASIIIFILLVVIWFAKV